MIEEVGTEEVRANWEKGMWTLRAMTKHPKRKGSLIYMINIVGPLLKIIERA
jgi:hypothetical protein